MFVNRYTIMILEIFVTIGFILYILFNSINFMDNYSEEVRENFKSNRNWNVICAILLYIVLYIVYVNK